MTDSEESGSTSSDEDVNQIEFALNEVIRQMEALPSDPESDTSDSDDENAASRNNPYHYFLRDYLKEDNFQNIVMTYDVVQNAEVTFPPQELKYATDIVYELLQELNEGQAVDHQQAELFGILMSPNIRCLIESYESICTGNYDLPYLPPEENQIYEVSVDLPSFDQTDYNRFPVMPRNSNGPSRDHFIGGSVKSSNFDTSTMRSSTYQPLQPKEINIDLRDCANLGITVTRRQTVSHDRPVSEVVVERVIADSPAQLSGIAPGDIIQFVNNQPIDSVDDVRSLLKKSSGTLSMRVVPQKRQLLYDKEKSYVRCLSTYKPMSDSLLPKGCAGIEYSVREVLEIVNREDSNYWQARRLGNGFEKNPVGLIPSDSLEEKRKAFKPVDINADVSSKSNSNKCTSVLRRFSSKKKNKIIFSANNTAGIFDRGDIKIYEDVTPLNPSRLITLVLIGPTGVGKRSVKEMIAAKKPNKFSAVKRDRLPSNPDTIKQVREGKFLEWNQVIYNNEIEGIRYSSIDRILKERKTAVIDCLPKNLRSLYTAEYCPFVVFLSAPPIEVLIKMQEEGMQAGVRRSMKSKEELYTLEEESRNMENLYGSQADFFVLNSNPYETVYEILQAVQRAEYTQRWIPVSWQYDVQVRPVPVQMSPPPSPPNLRKNSVVKAESYMSGSSSKVSSQLGSADPPIVKAEYVKFSGQYRDDQSISSVDRPSAPPQGARRPPPARAEANPTRQQEPEDSDTVTEDSSSDSAESSDGETGYHHNTNMQLQEVSV